MYPSLLLVADLASLKTQFQWVARRVYFSFFRLLTSSRPPCGVAFLLSGLVLAVLKYIWLPVVEAAYSCQGEGVCFGCRRGLVACGSFPVCLFYVGLTLSCCRSEYTRTGYSKSSRGGRVLFAPHGEGGVGCGFRHERALNSFVGVRAQQKY